MHVYWYNINKREIGQNAAFSCFGDGVSAAVRLGGGQMAMAKGSGIRAVCGALLAAIGVTLGISRAAAEDLAGSEQVGVSDAGDPAGRATDVGCGAGRPE
jgi:hypothetical protein